MKLESRFWMARGSRQVFLDPKHRGFAFRLAQPWQHQQGTSSSLRLPASEAMTPPHDHAIQLSITASSISHVSSYDQPILKVPYLLCDLNILTSKLQWQVLPFSRRYRAFSASNAMVKLLSLLRLASQGNHRV
jgi:hypothetical protein